MKAESMFDRWATPLTSSLPLKELENSMGEGRPLRIGVDAEHFIRKFAGKEPLNGALGGDPYLLETRVVTEISQLKKLNCELLFFFHGCDFGPAGEIFASANKSAEINGSAFAKYEENQPDEAIRIFKNNDFPHTPVILTWLKATLSKNSVPFLTAPFSAYAQMVDTFNQGSIDMYYSSSEIFVFGAGQIISNIDVRLENQKTTGSNGEEVSSSVVNLDASTFQLLDLEILASAHLHVPENLVRDVMILSGSSRLPMFQPWADAVSSSHFGFADATAILSRWDGNIFGLIESSPPEKTVSYWENYMQVATAIQYMPVLHHMNEVVPAGRRKDIPNDLQTALGLHLPDELNFYMYSGIIEPKMLNWLNVGKITITAPFEGGDAVYRKTVKDILHPWRRQNYSLLVSNLNRYFQKRLVSTEYWFETGSDNSFADEADAVDRGPLEQWRVSDKDLAGKSSALNLRPRTLVFALTALADNGFAEKTVSKRTREVDEAEVLKSADELMANVIWRGLFIRGYIDKQHKLTPWGKVAHIALAKSGETGVQNEAVFLAVEALRANVLSPKAIFAASQQEDKDKRFTEYIAKVMCVGSLVHQNKGYSGPLSRSLLAFHNSLSAIRASLRDLFEATMVNLLLWGEGERVRDDYAELARDMPFRGRNSCGLGIFISTYLDQYHERIKEYTSAASLNDGLKARMQAFVAHSNVEASIERINQIWDAFMSAVRSAADLLDSEDKQHLDEIDKWFAKRRPGTKNPLIANGA